MKVLLLIPTYNCQEQIGRLLRKSSHTINNQFDELLIIDNGSTDNTVNVAINNLGLVTIKTRVAQNLVNISLGGSLKTGFVYAIENSFDFVAVLHGDDQAYLDDLLPVMKKMENEKIDLAIGARFHPNSTLIGYSIFRKVGNRILNLYAIVCTQKKISDLIAGLNVFRVSKLELNQILNYPNNLTFDVHMLLRAIHLKQRIEFFPITWSEEDQVSNAKVVRQALTILGLFTRYFFLREKALKFQNLNNTYRNFRIVFEKVAEND
jgi:glycosyltransferase involved in cell wall biosynthesis